MLNSGITINLFFTLFTRKIVTEDQHMPERIRSSKVETMKSPMIEILNDDVICLKSNSAVFVFAKEMRQQTA